ncbi:hypothetical protein N072000002_04980 [Clostridium tetani]|uniref:Uncharacterized protein n=1 Tax=Clostridium tetani TaxID=1513 RepID=A0ABC8EAK1_CLOTA|nr:hypothetical protein K144312032_04990 [Clostridium tetani]BDR80247.1 hypothetical protein K234311028_04930 [Clostridium tetani]BDR88697.1 hypothetical protein N072000002_04980 [Clostridium tetani]
MKNPIITITMENGDVMKGATDGCIKYRHI